jgi:2-polyprenyl-3-methyl-5-hydroxy-6-metoxy-1,4-benzoquinol methylase
MELVQRIPEPELMESPEQARAYANADFSAPHDAFVACFRERFPDFGTGTAIDLGCGAADIAARFARAFVEVTVHGVDGAAAMLELGAEHVRTCGLGDRVSLQLARLPLAHPEAVLGGRYDVVISNSLLHHLADPAVLWQTARAVAATGAAIFVMDLRRPPSTEAADALVTTYAAGEHPLLRDDFLASLCAAYTPDEVGAQLHDAALPLRVEALGDRHLLVWGHLR